MPAPRPLSHRPPRFHWVALAVVVVLAGGAATEAQAKKKAKEPVYAGSVDVLGDWNFTTDCDYSSTLTFQYHGKYYPTALDDTATLDARTRTGVGGLNWTYSCSAGVTRTPSSGSCALGFETPPPGLHAGDEEFFFSEVKPGDSLGGDLVSLSRGLKVEFQLPNQVVTGSDCHGSLWGSGLPSPTTDESRTPQGFIRAKAIGKKVIVVPISGFRNASRPGTSVSGTLSATLTLTRLKSKKK